MSTFFLLNMMDFWLAGALSLSGALLIVSTRQFHLALTSRGHAGLEVQSAHHMPTPRVGGIALILGLLGAATHSAGEAAHLLVLLLVSCIPVFGAGLMEDINLGASPRARLFAAATSSALMIALTGQHISVIGVPGADALMRLWPVGVLFTVFATSGVSHAFNLVDGLNGLSMGIGIIAMIALGVIALGMGDTVIATLAAALAFSIVGVFVVNYPFGRLFLGDGGAYTMGHLIAWIAVLLMARNPQVSPWAVLMASFWPVMDTGAAILRRRINKTPTSAPDRMHFHHIVMRLILAISPRMDKRLLVANSMATAIMAPLFMVPPVLAVLTAQSNALAIFAFLCCAVMYVVVRFGLIKSFRFFRRQVLGLRDASLAPR